MLVQEMSTVSPVRTLKEPSVPAGLVKDPVARMAGMRLKKESRRRKSISVDGSAV